MLLLLAPIVAGGLINLLVTLLVLLAVAGLLFWAVNKLSAAFSIPEPIRTVIIVILVVVFVLVLLSLFVGGASLRL